MEVTPGYRQTEVGVIPEDWEVALLDKVAKRGSGHTPNKKHPEYWNGDIKWISLADSNALDDLYISDTFAKITPLGVANSSAVVHPAGTVVLSRDAGIGKSAIMSTAMAVSQHFMAWRCGPQLDNKFLYYWLQSVKPEFERIGNGSTIKTIGLCYFRDLKLPLPEHSEQCAIADALTDVDALLGEFERLIAKKRDLKQAAMQQLLTGQTRLPGFDGECEVKTLEQLADCLDGLRIPLNEHERATMKGDYPYCGANGVLDYVNGYVIDDDIILIAEDGGYFDEYETRPIAYRVKGKCWVNNHAHILKAKTGFDQGFLFYSLVHKNILPFLASGTRAKLNKSQLKKIEVTLPIDEAEQNAVAEVLIDMDAEIAALEQRREKTLALKQAMMQELLTGKTRLI